MTDELDLPHDPYIVTTEMSNCKVCGMWQDLRCGICFDCCDKVAGEKLKHGHRLWEINNPDNTWYTSH